MDTDSIYIKKKYMDLIDKNLIDENSSLLSMKNDYGEGQYIIKADFLMKKVKRLVILDKINKKISVKWSFKGYIRD